MKGKTRLLRKLTLFTGLLLAAQSGFCQDDAYIADTAQHTLFKNFVGLKLFIADFGAKSLNQDLSFKYTSVNPLGPVYTFNHDMNVKSVNGFYNIGLGLEENLGKHLVLNFFNASIGYLSNVLNWNVGIGAGYFINLNQAKSWRINASLNIYYQDITYGLGDYYDSTLVGFIVDGVNIGTSVKNVKYVNSIFSASPGVELMHRGSGWDFYADIYYNYVFSYHEKINFYVHSIPVSYALYDHNGNTVPRNAINMGSYIINIGIIREFGL